MRIGLHVLHTDRNDLKAIYYGVLLNELNSTTGGSLPFHSAEVAVPSDVIISTKTHKTKSSSATIAHKNGFVSRMFSSNRYV